MTWLDGHPLCMRVVLPCLESAEPGALLSELNGTSPARAEAATAADPVSPLDASIGYWYARLAENTRRLLPLVSLCGQAADMIVLLLASDQPAVPSRFAGATAHDWMTAVEDAHRAGLLTRAFTGGDDEYFGLFMIHPALPGYLARRWRRESPADYAAARQAAARALVAACAARCGQVRGQAGSETGNRVLPYIEFTRRAAQDFLSRALAEKMWPEAGPMLRLLEIFWDAWGLETEYDAWAGRVRAALTGPAGDAPPLDRPAGCLWWEASDRQALWKRALGQYDQAERIYKTVLSAVAGQAPSPELDACLAQSYRMLGAIAMDRNDLEEAQRWRAKELAVARPAPGPPEADLTFRQRGDAAAERGDLAAAGDFYRQSLASHERAGDREGRVPSPSPRKSPSRPPKRRRSQQWP
jgi:tetratricopeptide (TPR) repeat protein